VDGYRLELDHGVPLEEWNAHVSLLTGMAAAEIMLRGRVGILRTMPPADPDDVADFRAQTIALGLPWQDGVAYAIPVKRDTCAFHSSSGTPWSSSSR
jgi:hypothetical protein